MPAGPLVDTSVLIDYFRGARNREAEALDRLLADGPPPATAPLIVQEFLQGFPLTRDFERAQGWLELFDQLEAPGYELHERAARLHLALRRKGLMSSTVDALIVCVSAHAGRDLLTRDAVQRRLAELAGVTVWH